MTKLVIHTDGGARGNPGPAAIGVVVEVEGERGREVVAEIGEKIGVATNNVAEYRALIRGLEESRRLGATEVQCLLDSQLVVEQMSGRFKVKHANVVGLHREASDLARGFSRVTYRYVPRAQNAEADRLVNAALDGKPAAAVAPEEPAATQERAVPVPAPAPADLRRDALDLVRQSYYAAANMAGSDLEAINRGRPPGMRYESQRQLVHEYLLMAAAQGDFAVRLGLVEVGELGGFLKEFWAEQPDLIDQRDEAWIQQNLDLSPPARGVE